MNHLYRYYLLVVPFILQACSGSGSSGPVDPAANLPLNSIAIETCYDLKITINNRAQFKNICTTIENGGENGLGVARFATFNLNAASNVSISVSRTDGLNPADPDIYVYKKGALVAFANSAASSLPNQETLSARTLPAGDYVAEVREYVYLNTDRVLFKPSVGAQQKSLVNVQQAISGSPCEAVSDSFVSGNVVFDRVNFTNRILNYNNITQEPIQEAVVEIVCNGFVYSTSVTDVNGDYQINYPVNMQSILRISARMLKADAWNFSVVDNSFSSQPLYTMESQPFNESTNFNLNLRALSGWDDITERYLFPRVAAPFAILDSVRKAKDTVLSVANVNFPALNVNWSPLNSALTIESAFYDGEEIFLLGAEDLDTDEYDQHVIIHEWAHYFEDNFSRSDSIGGAHTRGNRLDIRTAFGEGFANAFSSMVTEDPVYKDSTGNAQSKSGSFNMDENRCSNSGWYSERSVHSIVFDIYDISSLDDDNVSLGFAPIYNVMTKSQKNAHAMTSIFSFINAIKNENPGSVFNIDTLLSRQRIDAVTDEYGSSQNTNNPGNTDQLPVYEVF